MPESDQVDFSVAVAWVVKHVDIAFLLEMKKKAQKSNINQLSAQAVRFECNTK